ncbi:type VII secretion system ESX-4 subunit EccB4 [Pseudonocardia petroleophila]|uniref:Type VII secretion protein EccB n=1 Tax=Pseudonocardia petroleophila TaxID=37331 RepID=A0A7G7MP91_9PSEU|nr:type VII secretion protein EccB [Pseudonocardia petroleophila]QNG54602.1 type VII secretion protein EccB [Pseudonocardia petroleophila]
MSTRAPATRDQVDAYRFGLRRMEAALVRGDPVPLHEQLRAQRRAALAGTLLGVLALGGVAVWAQVAPRPTWTQQDVVVGAGSGAMYVVAHDPDRLVPVANLPAGRLVLAALGRGDPAAAVPVLVADADLDTAARTPTAAVPGATAVRLGDAVIPPRWAVCDADDPDSGRGPRTTVVGGAQPVAPSPDAVLLAVRDGDTWLVTGGVRHRIDLTDRAVVGTLGLDGREPRAASAALLNALPEGAPLRTPRIVGAGAPAGAVEVGDVLVGRPVGGGPSTHHVVLAGGAQAVPPLVAQTLRAAGARVVEVEPEVLTALGSVQELDVAGWPDAVPAVREPGEAPVVCAVWSAAGGTAVHVGPALPVPPGAAGVDLVQADGAGELVDAVVLTPAGGGAVRATAPGRAGGAGPLWLVSASGVAHGVADEATAQALGVTRAEPAPEWAVRLLPVGPTLDLADAQRTVDVLPG